MKVSIITATYNSANTLEVCLNSVLGQTYTNIEYIIIDGNSSDQTQDILKKTAQINKNVRYISEPDKGIYDALNKGIHLATGDVIGFLHSDDIFADATIISKIVTQFKAKQVDGVYGDLQYVEKLYADKVIRNWKSCDFKMSLLKKGWMPAHPTLFLTKDVYKKHGFFDLSYTIAADYDFMLRILKDSGFKFSYLPIVITKMRVGGASNRSLRNILQKTKEDYRAATTNKIGGFVTIIQKNTSKLKQFF